MITLKRYSPKVDVTPLINFVASRGAVEVIDACVIVGQSHEVDDWDISFACVELAIDFECPPLDCLPVIRRHHQ